MVWLSKGIHRYCAHLFLILINVLSSSLSNVCPFCKAEPESLNHIFLMCRGIWESWNELLLWWDMKWVTPAAVVDLFHWWMGFKCKRIIMKLQNLVPMAMLWSIWKMRSDCIFNGCQPNLKELSGTVKWRVALQAKSNLLSLTIQLFIFFSTFAEVLL